MSRREKRLTPHQRHMQKIAAKSLEAARRAASKTPSTILVRASETLRSISEKAGWTWEKEVETKKKQKPKPKATTIVVAAKPVAVQGQGWRLPDPAPVVVPPFVAPPVHMIAAAVPIEIPPIVLTTPTIEVQPQIPAYDPVAITDAMIGGIMTGDYGSAAYLPMETTVPKNMEDLPKIAPTQKTYKKRIFPIPEVLDGEAGEGWKLREKINGKAMQTAGIGVDFRDKVMTTAWDDDDVSHALRLQQIARVKWDDPQVDFSPFGDSLLLRAVDDNRLAHLLEQKAKIESHAGFLDEDTFTKLGTQSQETAMLSFLLMTDYTGADRTEILNAYAGTKPVKLYEEARRRIAENPTKENVASTVMWLRTQIEDTPVPQMMKGTGKCSKPGSIAADQSGGKDSQDWWDETWDDLDADDQLQNLPQAVRDRLPDDMPESLVPKLRTAPHTAIHLAPWGELSIQEPPRVKRIDGRFYKKWKSTEEGVFPRYHHRVFTDGRVFARRTRVPGGTVLIDSSGSMAFTSAQIQAMVERAPGCTVACYSGTGTKGVLRILAKNGSRVADSDCARPSGGGNIVDFPALRWAYKMPHPRVWVTDFGVTGQNEQSGPANIVVCAAVVKKGRFFTARNAAEAHNLLGSLGRYYKKSS